ncbi:MAG: hypothetical protein EI684_10575, partial [Candidatus Viridilinea halotolerans]
MAVLRHILHWCVRVRSLCAASVAILLAVGFGASRAFACGQWNPTEAMSCEIDGLTYTAYESAASAAWSINRILLIAAYQLDAIRANVIEVAFLGAFTALTSRISPLIVPIASLAILAFAFALMLFPLTGGKNPFNLRHILVWTLVGPILLSHMGQWLIDFEVVRMEIGTVLFDASASANLNTTLGSPGAGGDFGAIPTLYPSVCGGASFDRHSGGTGQRIDELVAGYLFATATDIHCPHQEPWAGRLPSGYYQRSPTPYAVQAGVRGMTTESERRSQIAATDAGMQRQFVGLLPTALTVMYYLLNLIFALALVALWVAMPLGMLFGFFQRD